MMTALDLAALPNHRSIRRLFADRRRACKQKCGSFNLPAGHLNGKAAISSLLSCRMQIAHYKVFPLGAHSIEAEKQVRLTSCRNKVHVGWVHLSAVGFNGRATCPSENKMDNLQLHNPLLRQERMGCGWLAVIFEFEGVIVEDDSNLEKQAWLTLSQEEGKPPPVGFNLRRIEGMKSEQAISEVLCWSRDPVELRRLSKRREEIYHSLVGGFYQLRSGSLEFITTLVKYKIPMALVSTKPRKTLEMAVEVIGFNGLFNLIVGAEDVCRGKPDPEMFVYASNLLDFIPAKCIVFGNSNTTIEAAHDARMKCVAVASKHRVYELGGAEVVINLLDELTVVDLKRLADVDVVDGFDSPESVQNIEHEEPWGGHIPIRT